MSELYKDIKEGLEEAITIEKNRQLVAEMPYLLPHNRWTGKVADDYDYSYTELDMAEIPAGWDNLFLNFCREIKPVLEKVDCLNKFGFSQVKEKYGELVIYAGMSKEIANELCEIEDKYRKLSRKTCCMCGGEGKMTDTGYIIPFCRSCWEGNKYYSTISYDDAVNKYEEAWNWEE